MQVLPKAQEAGASLGTKPELVFNRFRLIALPADTNFGEVKTGMVGLRQACSRLYGAQPASVKGVERADIKEAHGWLHAHQVGHCVAVLVLRRQKRKPCANQDWSQEIPWHLQKVVAVAFLVVKPGGYINTPAQLTEHLHQLRKRPLAELAIIIPEEELPLLQQLWLL